MRHVLVNGVPVLRDGEHTGATARPRAQGARARRPRRPVAGWRGHQPAAGLAVTGANGFVGRHLVRLAAARRAARWWASCARGRRRAVEADGGRAVLVPGLDAAALAPALAGAGRSPSRPDRRRARGPDLRGRERRGHGARWPRPPRAAGCPAIALFSGLGVASYGMKRARTTRYFLSKLEAELRPLPVRPGGRGLPPVLRRRARATRSFRPCCVRLRARRGRARRGRRLSPAADRGARCRGAVLAALERPSVPAVRRGSAAAVLRSRRARAHRLHAFVARLAAGARAARPARRPRGARGRGGVRRPGGARGRLARPAAADELDCVLCDEVGDPAPLAALLGRFLTPLDEALGRVVRAS